VTLRPQSVIARGTFAFCWAPLWPVKTVSRLSGLAHRFARVASAECGPVGRSSLKLVTGTSGTELNDEVSRPLVVVVLCRRTWTPWPDSGTSIEGSVFFGPLGCATRYATPFIGSLSTGV